MWIRWLLHVLLRFLLFRFHRVWSSIVLLLVARSDFDVFFSLRLWSKRPKTKKKENFHADSSFCRKPKQNSIEFFHFNENAISNWSFPIQIGFFFHLFVWLRNMKWIEPIFLPVNIFLTMNVRFTVHMSSVWWHLCVSSSRQQQKRQTFDLVRRNSSFALKRHKNFSSQTQQATWADVFRRTNANLHFAPTENYRCWRWSQCFVRFIECDLHTKCRIERYFELDVSLERSLNAHETRLFVLCAIRTRTNRVILITSSAEHQKWTEKTLKFKIMRRIGKREKSRS